MLKIRFFLSIIILTVFAVSGFAQVDRAEMENLPPVVFINYEGPHAKIDTREQIRQLGVVLGTQVAAREKGLAPTLEAMTVEQRRNHSVLYTVGALNRYFVIHCVSGPEGNKLDADIFGLGVDAGVDHIRNLRWIIQGYLQDAYEYSLQDAAILAEYITIYNAVYRGNWDFFTERYKTQVINNLNKDRAGLSIRYDEWPGRTMMVIPLGHGGLSTIDTASLSDRRVIEELRREDDQGVPQRQGMVDLMERQAEEAERRAQQQREDVRQQERRIQEERQRVEQERQRAEQERQKLQQERRQIIEDREAGRISQEQARRQEEEIRRQEEELRKQEEELAQREQEAEEQDRALDEQRQEAERMEQYAEQQYDDARQQREEIARDQQAAIAQDTAPGVYGMRIERTDPTQMGRIVRINPNDGSEQKRSPLDTVHVRTVTFISGKMIAIAGENVGNRAVRLIELDQTSLEMAKQGDDDIYIGSLLWVNGSDLYAITTDLNSGACFLGRFDTALVLQAKSEVRVHPQASVTIQQGRLLTQRENGSPLILNPMDLK